MNKLFHHYQHLSRAAATLLILLLTMTAQTAWAVEAKTIIVQKDGGTGTYSTISAAISAAADGDMISIKNGEYTEAQTISLTKSLTIKGESQDEVKITGPSNNSLFSATDGTLTLSFINMTILDTGSDENPAIKITIANRVSIQNCTFNHCGGAIYSDARNDITILDCTFSSGTAINPGTSTTGNSASTSVVQSSVMVHEDPGKSVEYWCTFCPKDNMTIKTSGVIIYKAKLNNAKTSVTLTQVNGSVIKAGQAVMLKATASGTIWFEQTLDIPYSTINEYSDNDLKGGSDVPAGYDAYTLSAGADGSGPIGFYKFDGSLATPAATLDPNKAHLEIPASTNGARGFIGFCEDEATGIDTPPLTPPLEGAGNGCAQWYSIDGRRLSGQPTRKGIYVRNGKKMIIK